MLTLDFAFRVLVFLAGFLFNAFVLLSAVRTVVLPRSENVFLTRLVYIWMFRLFRLRIARVNSYERRDQIMALFAPVTLLALPIYWVILITWSYTAMYWALGVQPLEEAFRLSGSSLLTLGFRYEGALHVLILEFSEATIGLGLVALLISYLPSIYGHFSTREAMVNRLEVRAGSPPSAVEMIKRYHRNHGLDKLPQVWEDWELWFAQVEESHTSLVALVFFRSPKPHNSWVTAAGAVLDAAALVLSSVDVRQETQAALTIRAGFVALRSIADFFRIPYPTDPAPTDPISIQRAEFEAAYDELEAAGVPMLPNREECWRNFAGWRVNYDRPLLALAQPDPGPPTPPGPRTAPSRAASSGKTPEPLPSCCISQILREYSRFFLPLALNSTYCGRVRGGVGVMKPRVVIVGGGFGGVFMARNLADKPVDVVLIDKNNYHTFTPLLYQVATCGLEAGDVAHPIRPIFRKNENVNFMLGKVTAIDPQGQTVTVVNGDLCQDVPYDYLVIAAGSTVNYFGNEIVRQHSHQVTSLEGALALREHVLKNFEALAWTEDLEERERRRTIVIVGGGPTGLETAGAVYELYNNVLDRDFKAQTVHARVILVEMLEHVLAPYPPKLRESARKQLESLGVEVMLGQRVTDVTPNSVTLNDDTVIPTNTLIWTAGIKPNPFAEMLNIDSKRGRLPIEQTTQLQGFENIFAIGDIAYLEGKDGKPYPMLIPVAQQQGRLAAQNILRHTRGQEMQPFHHRDRGMMATIGRQRAVAWVFNRIPLTGWVAWFAWLGLHLVTLLGFHNRARVFISWIWNYITYDRSVRIIVSPLTAGSNPNAVSGGHPQTTEVTTEAPRKTEASAAR
ncbi:MAG: NAD(P)/FAD-dependent oxidoreductase [Anaerolineae bacterium]|nr:NAD(P)/FAD-dependent oxidoreductase [Anaerolineae bacterium]